MANKLKVGVDITSDGYTFLALTMGSYGEWAISLDLQEAIKRANCRRTNLVQVYYGKHSEMNVSVWGGLTWHKKNPPVPIGLFLANKNTIKFLKPKEVFKYFPNAKPNDDLHHASWVAEQAEMFEEHKK